MCAPCRQPSHVTASAETNALLPSRAPNSAAISIALLRLPASDPRRRIGSLFINPGGPGGSGVDAVVGAGPFLYTDDVRARFDVVGFDPRGIYRSTGLRCFDSPDEWDPYFTPFAFPITREEERIWIAADRFLTSACERRGGRIIDHMSTANAARDLDVLRAAVGDEKLTYAGYSYGSYLGVTYASLSRAAFAPSSSTACSIPSRGRRAAAAWKGGRCRSRPACAATRAQATLNEFFRLCDAGDDACAFSGHAAQRFASRRIAPGPLVTRIRTHSPVGRFETARCRVRPYAVESPTSWFHPTDNFYAPSKDAPTRADLDHLASEDGAVVVKYRPDLPRAARDALKRWAAAAIGVVVAPGGLSPLEAYTLDRRLTCDGVDLDHLTTFTDRHFSKPIEHTPHSDTSG